jgi:hypothetical protein
MAQDTLTKEKQQDIYDFLDRGSSPSRANLLKQEAQKTEPLTTPESIEALDDEDFLKKVPRIPRSYDFLLHFGADKIDKQNILSQVKYGEDNVFYSPKHETFIVRELDKDTGKVKYFRSDEKGVTWRDFEDVAMGIPAFTPEILTSIAIASKMQAARPQLPQTWAGSAALFGLSTLAGEVAGGLKDASIRHFGLKTDPRTKEIVGRRTLNTLLGTVGGMGINRALNIKALGGSGKMPWKGATDKEKALLKTLGPDELATHKQLMSREGVEAQKRLQGAGYQVDLTAGMKTQDKGLATLERLTAKHSERVPGIERPIEKVRETHQRAGQKMQKDLTKGGVDYEKIGQTAKAVISKEEEALRRAAQADATAAAAEVGEQASELGIQNMPKGYQPSEAGAGLREQLSTRAEAMADEVSTLYNAVEDKLAEKGVTNFVKGNNLEEAILKWRQSLPSKDVLETIETPASKILKAEGGGIVPATPAAKDVIKKEVSLGVYDDASKVADDWLAMAQKEGGQTLSQAQMNIRAIGEKLRAGSSETGSTPIDKQALNKFLRAAKQDLKESFHALKIKDAKLSTMWDEANAAHRLKVEALNSSPFFQKALKTGRQGGAEVNPRTLISDLASGKGNTGDLRLVKEMILKDPDGVASWNQLRGAVVDDLIGKPITIYRSLEEPLTLSSGKIIPKGQSVEVVDMDKLAKQMARLDDEFLRELFSDPSGKKVASIKGMLKDWEVISKSKGNVGLSNGMDKGTLDDIWRELDSTKNVSAARKRFKDAIRAEYKRRDEYIDLIGKNWRNNDYELIASNPEQFVDEILLSNKPSHQRLGREVFAKLPQDVQDQVRSGIVDRIFINSYATLANPASRTKAGGLIEGKKFVENVYGDEGRRKVIREMLGEDTANLLDDLAVIFKTDESYRELTGQAGGFSVETQMASGDIKGLLSTAGVARALFLRPIQKLISAGAGNRTRLEQLYAIKYGVQSPWLKKKMKMSAALGLVGGEKAAEEILELSNLMFEAGLEAKNQGIDSSLIGGGETPSREDIEKWLDEQKD